MVRLKYFENVRDINKTKKNPLGLSGNHCKM